MPRGDKSSYSSKQRRQAEHIEESYEEKGVSKKTAQKRAWATVNKQDGGARGKSATRSGSKKAAPRSGASGKPTAAKATAKKSTTRKSARK